ncbi:hypothetical protein Leryth_014423 [Lithospermum erythrorhizon]|nr:hypothetical protein Leryth_014423 [Lithospermum erythrorhizon]
MGPGEEVFEWEQSLDEENMYINLPPNVPKKLFIARLTIKEKLINDPSRGASEVLEKTIGTYF